MGWLPFSNLVGHQGIGCFHQANNWIKSPVAAIATQPLNHQILENKIQSRLTINGITIAGVVEVKAHAIAVGIPIPIAILLVKNIRAVWAYI